MFEIWPQMTTHLKFDPKFDLKFEIWPQIWPQIWNLTPNTDFSA